MDLGCVSRMQLAGLQKCFIEIRLGLCVPKQQNPLYYSAVYSCYKYTFFHINSSLFTTADNRTPGSDSCSNKKRKKFLPDYKDLSCCHYVYFLHIFLSFLCIALCSAGPSGKEKRVLF